MTTTIAGHTFDAFDRCPCGKRYGDICGVTREDIEGFGIAHTGRLLEQEYNEIQAENARRWEVTSSMGRAPSGK